jgi:ABC-2 type transport system permease protein
VKAYAALARITARSALTYRMAFVLSLAGVLFQFVSMLAVWRVLLADSSLRGLTWDQMRGYLLVAFASGILVGLFADFRMMFRIKGGDVALDLIKPVSYQEARFAEVLGALWIEVLVVVLVGSVMAMTTEDMIWPHNSQLILFVISMILSIPLKFIILYTFALGCFWTQNYMGIQWARIAIVNLFSGALIPLAYLPHSLAAAAAWSPFAGLVSTPALILVGGATGGHATVLVLAELSWVIVLWCGAKLVWRVAVRQLTVNGG